MAAVEALASARKRGHATAEEQQALAEFPGWGFEKNILNPNTKQGQTQAAKDLRAMMTPEDLRRALVATANSHYTTPEVIGAMWGGLRKLGFDPSSSQYRILETSAGSGLFFTAQPEWARSNQNWTLVEKDTVSGEILKYLLPNQDVRVAGIENALVETDAYDIAISNVPFAGKSDTGLHDAALIEKYGAETARMLTASLHNYFFVKGLESVKPGGVVAFITTRYTMDGQSHAEIRKWIAERADFLGAVRLPMEAFAQQAETEVVTDVIFLRKKGEGLPDVPAVDWVNTEKRTVDKEPFVGNVYFKDNKQNVIGVEDRSGTMYPEDPYNVRQRQRGNFAVEVESAIEAMLPAGALAPQESKKSGVSGSVAPEHYQLGEVFEDGGKFYRKSAAGLAVPFEVPSAHTKMVKGYIGLKSALAETISAQQGTAEQLAAAQKKLKASYEAFKKAHGHLHTHTSREVPVYEVEDGKKVQATDADGKPLTEARFTFTYRRVLQDDSMWPRVFSLERWDGDRGEVVGLADIFDKRVMRTGSEGLRADNPSDALIASINDRGGVDLAFMSSLTGMKEADLLAELDGQVFRDPATGGYEPRATYLSGNVVKKLREAQAEVEAGNEEYRTNVAELEQVQPPRREYTDFATSLGAPWMPEKVMQEWAREQFGGVKLSLTKYAGRWDVSWDLLNESTKTTISQMGLQPKQFFSSLFNDTQATVYTGSGNDRKPDAARTAETNNEIQNIREQFVAWVDANGAAQKLVEDAYNERVNVYQIAQYDGSLLTFPGLSPHVYLRAPRVNFVARAMSNPFSLAWHGVGSGKTFTYAMLMMKLRQTGLRNKPMLVTYRPTHEQIIGDMYSAYPDAKILAATDESFTKDRRDEFLAMISTGDWDMVVITKEQLMRLSLSPEMVNQVYGQQMEQLLQAAGFTDAKDLEKNGNRDVSTKAVRREVTKMEEAWEKALDRARNTDPANHFDKLGVDQLVVDEAHFFKGIPVVSTSQLNHSTSARAVDLLAKADWLRTVGGGVTFGTGTAVVNSMAEIHNWMRYTNPQALMDAGIEKFDDFARQYALKNTEPEVHISGKLVAKERLRKLVNLPDLAKFIHQSIDVVPSRNVADLKIPRLMDKTGNVTDKPIVEVVQPNGELKAWFVDFEKRYQALKPNPGPGDPNPLSLATEARMASQDLRLVDPAAAFDPEGKVARMVQNTADLYHNPKYAEVKATQALFVDWGTPDSKSQFNGVDLYNDIKKRLVKAGVNPKHIAFITDAKTPQARKELSQRMNSGQVRILIGSRAKMGVGMNIQDRMIAAHHFDVGWNPAMLEQGNGRILRHGNMFYDEDGKSGVMVFMYVNQGTFDQVTSNKTFDKGNVIDQFMSAMYGGETALREVDEVTQAEGAVSMAEVRAMSLGDPRVIDMFTKTQAKVKMESALKVHNRNVKAAQARVEYIPEQVKRAQREHEFWSKAADSIDFEATLMVDGQEVKKTPAKVIDEKLDALRRKEGEYSRGQLRIQYAQGLVVDLTSSWDWSKQSEVWVRRYIINGSVVSTSTFEMKPIPGKGEEGARHEGLDQDFALRGAVAFSGRTLLNMADRFAKEAVVRPPEIEASIEALGEEMAAARRNAAKTTDLDAKVAEITHEIERLSFETGVDAEALRKGTGGFGDKIATYSALPEPADMWLQTPSGEKVKVKVLESNSAGMYWVEDAEGRQFATRNVKESEFAVDAPEPSADNMIWAGLAATTANELDARLNKLLLIAKGIGVNAYVGQTKAKGAAGRFEGGTENHPRGRIVTHADVSADQLPRLVSHELGHAIDAYLSQKLGISKDRKATGQIKAMFNLDDATHKTVKDELRNLTKALVGLKAYNQHEAHFNQGKELFARFWEALLYAPKLVDMHAPTFSKIVADAAAKDTVIADMLKVAKGKEVEYKTPMFLPDRRQTFIKRLGRHLGTRAYAAEKAFQVRRAKAVAETARLIEEKRKSVKDDPEVLFTVAEGIRFWNSVQDRPVYGTRVFAKVDPESKEFAGDLGGDGVQAERQALLDAGYWYAGKDEDGAFLYEKWRVHPDKARMLYESLSKEGKVLIKEYTEDTADAKTLFNRELLADYADIEKTIEGYVKHLFDDKGKPIFGSSARLKKMKGSFRKKRSEAEGFTRDFFTATEQVMSEAQIEKLQNELIADLYALALTPYDPKVDSVPTNKLGQPTHQIVEGNMLMGFTRKGDRTIKIADEDGRLQTIRPGKQYLVPNEIYEEYIQPRIYLAETSQILRTFNAFASGTTGGLLVHPATWVTNAFSGAIQYSLKLTNDMMLDMLYGDVSMQRTKANILGALKTMRPGGIKDVEYSWGGDRTMLYRQFAGDTEYQPGAVTKALDFLLWPMGRIEAFFKAVTYRTAVETYKPSDEMSTEFIAAANDMIDLYTYDYDNIPAWLNKWRANPVARLTKPFMVYPYKYTKMLTRMVGSAFDRNLPWQERAAHILSLAFIMVAYKLAKAGLDDEDREVNKMPDDVHEDFEFDQITGAVDARGRTYVGKDKAGREVFVRMAKYPVFNATDAIDNLVAGDPEGAMDIVRDQLAGLGPFAEATLSALGYSNPYNTYATPGVKLAQATEPFIPGSRIMGDVADTLDPVKRRWNNDDPSLVYKQLVPVFWEPQVWKALGKSWDGEIVDAEAELPEWYNEMRGAQRTVKVPNMTRRDQAMYGGKYRSEFMPKYTDDELLFITTGILLKRIDPEWYKATMAKENELAEGREDRSQMTKDKEIEKARKNNRRRNSG